MTEVNNNAAMDALSGLAQAMLASVQPQIDAQIQREIEAQKAKIGVRKIEIVQAGEVIAKFNGRVHKDFETVLKLVNSGLNVMLKGPAGCGKTRLAGDVARALKAPFSSISCTAGMSEGDLLGRASISKTGSMEYVSAPFVDMYENGGQFLLDELDAGDSNVLLVLNQATSNGGMTIGARKLSDLCPYVKRHPDNRIIAATNTYGTGAGSMYVGRNQLDAAFLDRWVMVDIDYDRDLEAELGSSRVCNWVWNLRDKLQDSSLRRLASTRAIQKMETMLQAGLDWQYAKSRILAGYTKDELQKVGEA